MKRYLVFYGDDYYPGGGMEDFVGDFDSLDEGIRFVTDKDTEWRNKIMDSWVKQGG